MLPLCVSTRCCMSDISCFVRCRSPFFLYGHCFQCSIVVTMVVSFHLFFFSLSVRFSMWCTSTVSETATDLSYVFLVSGRGHAWFRLGYNLVLIVLELTFLSFVLVLGAVLSCIVLAIVLIFTCIVLILSCIGYSFVLCFVSLAIVLSGLVLL